MEYHSDRFTDFSLIFMDTQDQLVALLPANVQGATLMSHEGLTFGGVISGVRMKATLMLEIFGTLRDYLRTEGLNRIVYKAVPHIYHRLPTDEDLYALYRYGAKLVGREVSSAIYLADKLPFNKGRRWAIKQGQKAALEVGRSYDFNTFMAIEEQVLNTKYRVKPVHSADELQLLADRFPENIKLFTAHKGERMLAGVIVYESYRVAHAQYISASEEGKSLGALDVILDFLINNYYANKTYFDFGISTEKEGTYLNEGLIGNKESFGARAVVHDCYEIELATN